MPSYGPWVTPPTVTTTAVLPYSATIVLQLNASASTFALACEWSGSRGDADLISAAIFPAFAGHLAVAVSIDDLTTSMGDTTPPLPPNASGVDYDPADPLGLTWLTGTLDVALDLERIPSSFYGADDIDDNGTWPITGRIEPVAALTIAAWPSTWAQPGMTEWPDQANAFVPGTALATLPSGGSTSIPPVGTGNPGVADYTFTIVTAPTDFTVPPGGVRHWGLLYVHFDAQVSHTEPAQIVHLRPQYAGPATNINPGWMAPTVTFTYQPRRYRFVYDVLPPLRQYPRDDFLGGAPRQGHVNQPKSTQASARQGWANVYR